MANAIIGGTSRQARLDALEAEVAQIKVQLEAEREGGMEEEGTSRIEEFDSMQLEELL